jgi:uncharacterized protein
LQALSAARSLIIKGAHFITAVAFMFASTNLVIELGILILIFLGWQFLAGEIVGGLVLIAISSILIHLTYPKAWLQEAREKVEDEAPDEKEDFDWRKRLKSREGWQMVGHQFVMEWQMVWEEVLIGFTIAGFRAVFVPQSWWAKIFLIEAADTLPNWLILLENAAVAPFVAPSGKNKRKILRLECCTVHRCCNVCKHCFYSGDFGFVIFRIEHSSREHPKY